MKRARLLLIVSCLSTVANAQESCPSEEADRPHLTGLFLVNSYSSIGKENLDHVTGVVLDSVDLPGSTEALSSFLSEYWCKPITEDTIEEIKQKLVLYYRKYNRPFVIIQVPQDQSQSNVLQFVVYESRLGEIKSLGNQYFSSQALINGIKSHKGDRINSDALVRDLDWLNRNPFRTTNLVFTPSATPGYTDIELVTEDRSPWRIYSGVDNTGIAQTGHNRWFAGLNWGNAFGLGHIFTYQFTTASEYNKFWAHSVNYTAPLPCHHTLDIYGGYSGVRASLESQPSITTEGHSAQASMRYEMPVNSYISLLQEFTVGFDWKWTNTNLLNDEILILGKVVNITQLVANFNLGYETDHTKTSATIEVLSSPGPWLPNQENSHYNSLRLGAKNTYVYGRAALSSILNWKPICVMPTFRMQLSSANLLASEQFSLGGYDTVRGYEERVLNFDNGALLNFELRTPKMHILGKREGAKALQDDLVFLAFFDYGYGWNHKLYSDETPNQYLIGVGPGLRYVIQRYLTVRLDYGFKLHDLKFNASPNKGMLYFSAILSY